MTTSQHLQLNLESLTSLQEDSPAKIYQLQVYRKVLPKKPDQVYFTNSSESYAWYDPDTSSWKTWQRSLIEGWTSFSGNFTKQGMMQNGQLYQQVLWEPVISEADGGSLPTPTAADVEGGVARDVQYKNGNYFRENKQGVRWGVKLRDAVLGYIVKNGEQLKTNSTQTGKDTNLNPHFVEEMMGYPIGWTDLRH